MMQWTSSRFILGCLVLMGSTYAQGDSLRSALRAMSQRQKDLGGYDNLYYSDDDSNDVPFLRNYMDREDPSEKLNYDYVEEPEMEKRIPSSFRERITDEERDEKMEDLAKSLMSNWRNNDIPDNYDDAYLRKLWNRYNDDIVDFPYYKNEKSKRRVYYPTYGIENIGLRKRGKYLGNSGERLYTYNNQRFPREEGNEYLEYPPIRNSRRTNNINHHFHNSKRFLVAKRSSEDYKTSEQKRSVKKQTDPRVEKELSNIFDVPHQVNLKENKVTAVKPVTPIPLTTRLPAVDFRKNIANIPSNMNKPNKTSMNPLNREVFLPVAPMNEQPIKSEKKSVKWSEYFGYDRRKKSENSGLDKQWLMDRYHKAVAITAKKRNADLPLNFFRDRDELTIRSGDEPIYSTKGQLDEGKIEEFASTLKTMEEKLIDDALKYTGAHQGESDSAELQKVKNNIINSLAAAYNFEKMRNALEEYKNTMEQEKSRLKQEGKLLLDDYTYEEKRVSVPRKEAVDQSRESGDGDNNVKCTTSEDCHEQNYKTPADVLENHINNIDRCPPIEKACNDIASIAGHYGHVFEGACNIYQMCLLCNSNSWFSPTRHCNVIFLDKAYEMCLGKEDCQKEAQRSIRYMLDINKSLQTQSAVTDDCDLPCPGNDQLASD